jgi:hypothetical protein
LPYAGGRTGEDRGITHILLGTADITTENCSSVPYQVYFTELHNIVGVQLPVGFARPSPDRSTVHIYTWHE